MKPPPRMPITKGKVLKLLRALYGLNQSPRAWYEKFRKTMEAWGWRVSAYDPCVFIHPSVQVILCLWVDDMLIFYKNDGLPAVKKGNGDQEGKWLARITKGMLDGN